MSNRFGGRPKLPRHQLRDQRVVTLLTGEERALLQEIDDDTDVSISKARHDLIVTGMDQMNLLRADTKSAKRKKW